MNPGESSFPGWWWAAFSPSNLTPRRERLALVRVDRGGGEEVAVVCGARNIKEGQKVPLALPGARLPGLPKPLEALELGGVLSQGMLCSAQELGLELVQEAEDPDLGSRRPAGRPWKKSWTWKTAFWSWS